MTAPGKQHGTLVLDREIGQSIDVDGPCQITVIGIRGYRIKVAFSAPLTTKIMRTELVDGTKKAGRPKPKPVDRPNTRTTPN